VDWKEEMMEKVSCEMKNDPKENRETLSIHLQALTE